MYVILDGKTEQQASQRETPSALYSMGKAPCCDKERAKKGSWSAEEDAVLKAYLEKHPVVTNWIALPKIIGLNRCGKGCRFRWLNYLRPDVRRGNFSKEEEKIISNFYFSIGSRWSTIAEKLPGRTDNEIKNYWNQKMKTESGINKRKSRPRHAFTGYNNVKTKTLASASASASASSNGLDTNNIKKPAGRRSTMNVFTITDGDVVSTSWPSTSRLLTHPPSSNNNHTEKIAATTADVTRICCCHCRCSTATCQ